MSAVDERFRELKAKGRKGLVPFVTAGDPDLDFTAAALAALNKAGATICELGVPYTDPIADGPVIQASYTRALANGIRLDRILETAAEVAPKMEAPVVAMLSYAIVHRRGGERFVAAAQEAGLSGAIVPDLPVDEAEPLAKICRASDFSLIQLVTPTTPRERALRIAETTSGFLYYVSVTGITGERKALPEELADNVSWLRQRTELPVCIGFGISTPEHAKALAPAADGLIVGSAFVRRIAAIPEKSREEALAEIEQLAASLIEAMNEPGEGA